MNIDNNEFELLNNIFNSSVENTIQESQEQAQHKIETVENSIQEVQEQAQQKIETVENSIQEAQEQAQHKIEIVENSIQEAHEQAQHKIETVENSINKLPKINKTLENTINDIEFKTYIHNLNNINKYEHNNSDSDNNSDNNSDNDNDINGNENNNMVRFQNMSLNEIKTIDRFSNSLVLPSENSNISESEYSYTQNVKSPTTNYNKPIKHIRATKSQKQVDGIEEIDYVYNKLQDYVRYMTINRTNYIVIICKAIEIIENYKELKNSKNKKNIVSKSLNRIISLDLELSEFDKHLFINTMSNLIDLIINCTKKIDSNTVKQMTVFDDDIILAKSGQIIHSLIDKLTTIVVKKHYCIAKMLANVATLTHILMILVDKYIYLSGLEKKIIIIQSINSFITDRLQFIMEIDPDKIEPLKLSLDTVPITIDLLISLKKGKYKINMKDEVYTHKVKKSFFTFKKKNKKKNILENYVY